MIEKAGQRIENLRFRGSVVNVINSSLPFAKGVGGILKYSMKLLEVCGGEP
jgi:hypothetical protein